MTEERCRKGEEKYSAQTEEKKKIEKKESGGGGMKGQRK